MPMYYNIHTHHPAANTDTLAIQSLYQDFGNMLPGNSYSIGLHPAYLQDHEAQYHIITQLASLPEVLAIGECGLDKLVHAAMPLQTKIFIQHIDLANQLQKPLIIHCVQAHEELLQVCNTHLPQVPVIIHGYNKRDTVAGKFTDKGFYLSFGAAILRTGSPAIDVLKHIPPDRFFLETDDAGVLIQDIYAKAAEIRNTTIDSLILQLHHNYQKVFTR